MIFNTGESGSVLSGEKSGEVERGITNEEGHAT